MRIKINGDNNCARATRHLLRLAGFAVTDYLPADAELRGPHAGYAITIEVATADASPNELAPATLTPDACLEPDRPTQEGYSARSEEAARSHRDASSPAFAEVATGTRAMGGTKAKIHIDSMESALEAAVLRHVTQLAAEPVIVDRPGGMVHSDRELRIVVPNTGDARADEAAAVAVEFGVLRGLLDLIAPADPEKTRDGSREARGKKRWWVFGALVIAGALGGWRANSAATPRAEVSLGKAKSDRLKPVLLAAQGQFATGQGFRITDGNDFLVIDPCKGQAKSFASINQTANTQVVTGTTSEKIYVCSIHVVVAAATNVAVVEGTGSVCGTGTAGVNGLGGSTAATGWNFAANGGIALGNGDSSVGAEGASGDSLCVFSSGSGQVSGGISYVVQ